MFDKEQLFLQKGVNPDVLVMTANTNSKDFWLLILYGDLDISIIDELPPNRKKIETFLQLAKEWKKE